MSRRGPWRSRALAITLAATASAAMVAGAVIRLRRPRRPGADAQARRPEHREAGRPAARPDDARGEARADPAAGRQPGARRRRRRSRGRRRLQPHRPGEDQPAPAHRGRAVAAAHPDPVRVRHDPRLQDDLPDPARGGLELRSGRRGHRRHDRRARVDAPGSSRSTARWSTSRTSRAGAGSPRARARTRTSARSWPRPASAPRRATTTARPTRSSRARSTSPPTASPRAAASTTRPTCPSSGCGTCTCRRSRRRSTRAPTRRCARSTPSTACPGCANPETETQILKNEWGFDGFIESDFTAVAELRACPPVNPPTGPCGHGLAADGPDAARLALNAGTDSEMVSTNVVDFGAQLVRNGQVSIKRIDDAVRRILRVKFRAGLFEHPFVDEAAGRGEDDAARRRRRRAQRRRPLDGPAEERRPDAAVLDPTSSRSPSSARSATTRPTCSGRGPGAATRRPSCRSSTASRPRSRARTSRSRRAATSTARSPGHRRRAGARPRAADVTVLVVGESAAMSGEASSRADISLPGHQEDLIAALKETGKPFAVVLMNGRPLTLDDVDANAPAILEAWFRGIQGGNAVADVAVRQGQPGRQAAGHLPAHGRADPAVLQPREHGPARRPEQQVHLEVPRRAGDAALRVRVRPELHDVHRLEPAPGLRRRCRRTATSRRPSTCRTRARAPAMTSSSSTSTTRSRASSSRSAGCAASSASRSTPGQKRTLQFTLGRDDVGFYDNTGRFVVEPGAIDVFAERSLDRRRAADVPCDGALTRAGVSGLPAGATRPAGPGRAAVRSARSAAWRAPARNARRWASGRPRRRRGRAPTARGPRRRSEAQRAALVDDRAGARGVERDRLEDGAAGDGVAQEAGPARRAPRRTPPPRAARGADDGRRSRWHGPR